MFTSLHKIPSGRENPNQPTPTLYLLELHLADTMIDTTPSSSSIDESKGQILASSAGPASLVERGRRRRGDSFSQNPVVSAMLSSNNMNDCYQVRDLYSTCDQARANGSSPSMICEAAIKYFVSCSMSEK